MLAGMLATVGGDLHGIYSVFEGWAPCSRRARDVRDVLGSNCLGWLCPGDAGDAEEELLVQQSTSAIYPCR